MVCTRPDIAHAVGIVSRLTSNPGALGIRKVDTEVWPMNLSLFFFNFIMGKWEKEKEINETTVL